MATSASQSQPDKLMTVEKKDLNWYLPLYKFAIKGNWESARIFLDRDPDAVTAMITETSKTVLHIAVETGKAVHFVEKLLELIPPEALESMTDLEGETALHLAARVGNIEAAKLLVSKNPRLPNILAKKPAQVPLHFAAAIGQREMVSYLMTVTRDDVEPNPFANEAGVTLLNLVIVAEFYDVALQLVQRYPRLATLKSSRGNTSLNVLAEKPSAFLSGSHLNFWKRFVYSCVPVKFENFPKKTSGGDVETSTESCQLYAQMCCWVHFLRGKSFISVCQKLHEVLWEVIEWLAPHVKHIKDTKLMHHQTLQLLKCLSREILGLDYSQSSSVFGPPILRAARLGILEVVEEISESFPPAVWYMDKQHHHIFLLAVKNRRENVFNLIYQLGEDRNLVTQTSDIEENTILHLAGKLAPPHQLNLVSGAALQMQRELQWYKEVEKIVVPDFRERENSAGKTPAILFTEEHKDLVGEGETWMKDTAKSCTAAATLIATIAFAAAITIPGGNDGDNGLPIFSKEAPFIIFAISNALSLFSSSASLLMFLPILTARYAEADFLYTLPNRLVIGLVALFLSITFMMVTFSATFYIVFGHKRAWVLIPVAASACLPVTLFVFLQFPLLMDMIKSTYGPGIFRKKSEISSTKSHQPKF